MSTTPKPRHTPTPPTSPPPFPVPQNTPANSRPTTSATPTSKPPPPLPLSSASSSSPTTTPSLPTLLTTLLPPSTPLPSLLFAPPSTLHPPLTPLISALALHPTLETALHLLNADLPSAHFLIRHMQAPPALEGMLLHALLHRMEGDFDNARAWLGDARDAGEGWVPKRRGEENLAGEVVERGMGKGVGIEGRGLLEWVYEEDADANANTNSNAPLNSQSNAHTGEAERLLDAVEQFRKTPHSAETRDGVAHALEARARREMERILEWCVRKFGDGTWLDARSAWVRPGDDVRRMGQEQVHRGNGMREF